MRCDLKKFVLPFVLFSGSLMAFDPPPLLSIGAGYWDARRQPSGGLIQAEYKFGKVFWKVVRPQAELIIPTFNSLFVGVGVALEIHTSEHLVFSPNFSPGLYFKGNGTDLGFPLEFRSCLELAYEFDNCSRLGFQFYHISNASLGDRNPGVNATTLFFAFPLPK